MAYRTSAKNEPRARPAPALVVHNRMFWAAFVLAAAMFLTAIGLVPVMLGTSVSCARSAPGAEARCTLHEWGWLFFGGGTLTFAGKPGELHTLDTTVTDDEPATRLGAGSFMTRPVSERGAKAAVREYETFVATPDALSFNHHVFGSFMAFVLPLLFVVLAPAAVLAGTRTAERDHRLIVDAEAGELVVEKRWLRRPPLVKTYALSEIEAVKVEGVDDTDWYEVWVTVDEREQPLVRAGRSGCEEAAAVIRAAAKIG